jgi:hypothetical protein
MSFKVWRIAVASAFLGVLAATTSAAQASTAGPMSVSDRSAIVPNGIGSGNGISPQVGQYPMISAPVNGSHYVGTAFTGDDLADVCYILSGGQKWQLVMDRMGVGGDHYPATVGFVPQSVLTSDPTNGPPCPPTFATDSVGQNGLVTMYSAPHADTYVVGVAHGSDVIVDLCAVTVNNTPWIWVLDTSGWGGDHFANTTGFVPYWDLVNPTQVINLPC